MSDLQFSLGKSDPPAKSAGIFGTIFLFLFGLPFLGFGVFAIKQAVSKFIEGKTKDALMLGLFGLVFASAGLGVMFLSVWSRKKSKREKELKACHPDQPWLLRDDWAAGRIKSSVSAQVKMYSIMALAFCSIGGMYTFVALPKELHNGNYKALIVLIFPAIGIGFLIAVVRATLAQRRFGDCFFELPQVPIPLGGTLDGMIQTGARIRLEHGLHFKLSCVRRPVSRSGNNRNVREDILWQAEKVFKSKADLPEPEPGRSGIPVFFKMPANQPECFARGNEAVFWRLEARAKMSGPNFAATFEVPVFHVTGAAVAEEVDEPDPTAELQMPIEELRRDEDSKIQVTDGPNGREFYFPAARNIGAAIFTTILFLAFSGGLYAMIANHFSIVFEMGLGLFAVILGCFTFSLWLKSTRIAIDFTGVRATNHWLFFSRKRQFDAGEVVRIEIKIGMTSGSQTYQDLKLITQSSESTLASGIASAPKAAWLVQEMTKALGLQTVMDTTRLNR